MPQDLALGVEVLGGAGVVDELGVPAVVLRHVGSQHALRLLLREDIQLQSPQRQCPFLLLIPLPYPLHNGPKIPIRPPKNDPELLLMQLIDIRLVLQNHLEILRLRVLICELTQTHALNLTLGELEEVVLLVLVDLLHFLDDVVELVEVLVVLEVGHLGEESVDGFLLDFDGLLDGAGGHADLTDFEEFGVILVGDLERHLRDLLGELGELLLLVL